MSADPWKVVSYDVKEMGLTVRDRPDLEKMRPSEYRNQQETLRCWRGLTYEADYFA